MGLRSTIDEVRTRLMIFFTTVSYYILIIITKVQPPRLRRALLHIYWVAFFCVTSIFDKLFPPEKRKTPEEVAREKIQDKVVLITRSANCLGRLLALKFAKYGAKVVLWDTNTNVDNETLSQIKAADGKGYSYTVDLNSESEINTTAALVKKDAGNVHILINNAEISNKGNPTTVNLDSLNWTAHAFMQNMLDTNSGQILMIPSKNGHIGDDDLHNSESGEALMQFLEKLHAEVREKNRFFDIAIYNMYYDGGLVPGPKYPTPEEEAERFVESQVLSIINERAAGTYFITLNYYLSREAYAVLNDDFLSNETARNSVNH